MELNDITTVGVVGCGLMGAGITEILIRAGYCVVVRERDEQLLTKGLGLVHTSLAKAVAKGKVEQAEKDASLSRLQGTLNLEDLSRCELVIEAVSENIDLKKSVFKDLEAICASDTILATNTSSLCITEIAAVTRKPEKVLGLHFFNPVPVMPLVEIVPGLMTSPDSLAVVRQLCERLGKTVVLTRDRPGFIVNLLLIPYLLDAIGWLDAGLATKEDIDAAMRLGAGHPMGPLALADLIGLDTVLSIGDALHEELRDTRYVVPALLRRMVKAGQIGRKAGCGFYSYTA